MIAWAFFNNNDYGTLWPELALEVDIVNGLKDGSNKVIKFTNTTNNLDYYLIGPSSSTYNQIYLNPLFVVYELVN